MFWGPSEGHGGGSSPAVSAGIIAESSERTEPGSRRDSTAHHSPYRPPTHSLTMASTSTTSSGTIPQHVSEDIPPDHLEGTMDLLVILPSKKNLRMSVSRRTPMMDLLIQVTTSNRINPGDHIVQVRNEIGRELQYKPSTPIGSLDTTTIEIVPKHQVNDFIIVKKQQLASTTSKIASQPFEHTFRLQIHLPKNQLHVMRVGPKALLQDILEEVCQEKNLDTEKYEIRHPINLDEKLSLTNRLGDYGLQQIRVVSKTFRSNSSVSAADILALQTANGKRSSGQGSCLDSAFKYSRSSVGDSSVSSESATSARGTSPSRSDDSRSISPVGILPSQIKSSRQGQPPIRLLHQKSLSLNPLLEASSLESSASNSTSKLLVSKKRAPPPPPASHPVLSQTQSNPPSSGTVQPSRKGMAPLPGVTSFQTPISTHSRTSSIASDPNSGCHDVAPATVLSDKIRQDSSIKSTSISTPSSRKLLTGSLSCLSMNPPLQTGSGTTIRNPTSTSTSNLVSGLSLSTVSLTSTGSRSTKRKAPKPPVVSQLQTPPEELPEEPELPLPTIPTVNESESVIAILPTNIDPPERTPLQVQVEVHSTQRPLEEEIEKKEILTSASSPSSGSTLTKSDESRSSESITNSEISLCPSPVDESLHERSSSPSLVVGSPTSSSPSQVSIGVLAPLPPPRTKRSSSLDLLIDFSGQPKAAPKPKPRPRPKASTVRISSRRSKPPPLPKSPPPIMDTLPPSLDPLPPPLLPVPAVPTSPQRPISFGALVDNGKSCPAGCRYGVKLLPDSALQDIVQSRQTSSPTAEIKALHAEMEVDSSVKLARADTPNDSLHANENNTSSIKLSQEADVTPQLVALPNAPNILTLDILSQIYLPSNPTQSGDTSQDVPTSPSKHEDADNLVENLEMFDMGNKLNYDENEAVKTQPIRNSESSDGPISSELRRWDNAEYLNLDDEKSSTLSELQKSTHQSGDKHEDASSGSESSYPDSGLAATATITPSPVSLDHEFEHLAAEDHHSDKSLNSSRRSSLHSGGILEDASSDDDGHSECWRELLESKVLMEEISSTSPLKHLSGQAEHKVSTSHAEPTTYTQPTNPIVEEDAKVKSITEVRSREFETPNKTIQSESFPANSEHQEIPSSASQISVNSESKENIRNTSMSMQNLNEASLVLSSPPEKIKIEDEKLTKTNNMVELSESNPITTDSKLRESFQQELELQFEKWKLQFLQRHLGSQDSIDPPSSPIQSQHEKVKVLESKDLLASKPTVLTLAKNIEEPNPEVPQPIHSVSKSSAKQPEIDRLHSPEIEKKSNTFQTFAPPPTLSTSGEMSDVDPILIKLREKNPPQQPIYRYSGPPAVQMGTWGERTPKSITIKKDNDYISGMGTQDGSKGITEKSRLPSTSTLPKRGPSPTITPSRRSTIEIQNSDLPSPAPLPTVVSSWKQRVEETEKARRDAASPTGQEGALPNPTTTNASPPPTPTRPISLKPSFTISSASRSEPIVGKRLAFPAFGSSQPTPAPEPVKLPTTTEDQVDGTVANKSKTFGSNEGGDQSQNISIKDKKRFWGEQAQQRSKIIEIPVKKSGNTTVLSLETEPIVNNKSASTTITKMETPISPTAIKPTTRSLSSASNSSMSSFESGTGSMEDKKRFFQGIKPCESPTREAPVPGVNMRSSIALLQRTFEQKRNPSSSQGSEPSSGISSPTLSTTPSPHATLGRRGDNIGSDLMVQRVLKGKSFDIYPPMSDSPSPPPSSVRVTTSSNIQNYGNKAVIIVGDESNKTQQFKVNNENHSVKISVNGNTTEKGIRGSNSTVFIGQSKSIQPESIAVNLNEPTPKVIIPEEPRNKNANGSKVQEMKNLLTQQKINFVTPPPPPPPAPSIPTDHQPRPTTLSNGTLESSYVNGTQNSNPTSPEEARAGILDAIKNSGGNFCLRKTRSSLLLK